MVFVFVLMTTPAPKVLEAGLAGAGRVRVPGPLLRLLQAEPRQDGLQLRLAQESDYAHPTLRLQSHAPLSPVQDQIFQTNGKTRKSSVIIITADRSMMSVAVSCTAHPHHCSLRCELDTRLCKTEFTIHMI